MQYCIFLIEIKLSVSSQFITHHFNKAMATEWHQLSICGFHYPNLFLPSTASLVDHISSFANSLSLLETTVDSKFADSIDYHFRFLSGHAKLPSLVPTMVLEVFVYQMKHFVVYIHHWQVHVNFSRSPKLGKILYEISNLYNFSWFKPIYGKISEISNIRNNWITYCLLPGIGRNGCDVVTSLARVANIS